MRLCLCKLERLKSNAPPKWVFISETVELMNAMVIDLTVCLNISLESVGFTESVHYNVKIYHNTKFYYVLVNTRFLV